MGTQGLKLYSEIPLNDSGNVTMENATKYMYEQGLDEKTIGQYLYSVMTEPKESSDMRKYYDEENYYAIARHYKKKYKVN